MEHQFKKHYTREEARAMLPQARKWLGQVRAAQKTMSKCDDRIVQISRGGADVGGNSVNEMIRSMVSLREVAGQLAANEIQIKDLERGLVDFPAIIGGKEVFLCWEDGEEDIEHWHDLDAGYSGREPLEFRDRPDGMENH